MRRIVPVLVVLAVVICGIGVVAAQSATVDKTASEKLTKYLHSHRLPMVGAQISNGDAGRQLMLYGFVATDFGKDDAVTKSRKFLHDSTIPVVNNIRVNPQLKHLKPRAPSYDENGSGGMDSSGMNSGMTPPPRADWENTFDNTLRSGGAMPSNDPALKMPAPGGPAPVAPGGTW